MTLAEARRAALLANSYTRIDVVMNAYWELPTLDWFALLGSEWSGCDNISRWLTDLKSILKSAGRAALYAIMKPAEHKALSDLPPRITVYRGCYPINRRGLSWTLDRDLARRFPTLMR